MRVWGPVKYAGAACAVLLGLFLSPGAWAAVQQNFLFITPAAQLSTDAVAPVVGSDFDTAPYLTVSYTIRVADNAVKWEVFGANASNFADEVSVQAEASVAAAGKSSYAATQAVYRYYRVKIRATVGGSQGTATVVGLAKAG